MKKNVYLTILTIVTVICIIAGSIYHIVGWGFSWLDRLGGFWSSWGTSAGATVTLDSSRLDDFTAISADVSVMKLTLTAGDAPTISYKCSERLVPIYKVEDGVLTITQNRIKRPLGKSKCEVTLTVPQESLSRIEIDSAVGDIDINGLQGSQLSLTASVGDVDVTDCSFSDVEIYADVGDVDIADCTFDGLTIDASVGDVDVASAADLSNYTIDLSTSVGEVKVNGTKFRRSFSQDGGTGQERIVSISCSTGDVSLEY